MKKEISKSNCDQHSCQKCHCLSKTIFSNSKDAILKIISDNKVESHYKKGQTLFVQGSPSHGIYCIKKGTLKNSRIGHEGKDLILELVSEGDILGVPSLFENAVHTTTATALNDVTVCFLDKKRILSYLKQDTELSLNILKKMTKQKIQHQQTTYSSPHKNVRERMAELLLILREKHSTREKNKYKINIHLSREDMASIIGTATETVIRFISEFKSEGILEQEGKTIIIKNVSKLESVANM